MFYKDIKVGHSDLVMVYKIGDPTTNRIKDMLQRRFSFDVLKR